MTRPRHNVEGIGMTSRRTRDRLVQRLVVEVLILFGLVLNAVEHLLLGRVDELEHDDQVVPEPGASPGASPDAGDSPSQSPQARPQPDSLDAQMQQAEQDRHRLLFIPGYD